MNHAQFQERWEMEAAKESEHYRALIALADAGTEGFEAVQLSARSTHNVASRLTHFEAHVKKRKP